MTGYFFFSGFSKTIVPKGGVREPTLFVEVNTTRQ